MIRRAVVRSDFNSQSMSCNYWQQERPNDLWRLHLADGSLVDDPVWIRLPDLGNELIARQHWIELRPDETIFYMGKKAF